MLLDDELEGEVDAEDQEGEDAAADNEDGKPTEEDSSDSSEEKA